MDSLIFTYEGYEHTNIGDYIQGLAAKQYCGDDNIIYYHRDKLNQYKGPDVKVIMNGWFTHKPENWPPSKYIHPLFVSFHINVGAYEYLLSENSIQYFKQFEPIGCRDENTANILRNKGVNAYFSSCLTTTLGYKYSSNKERSKIYVVDPVYFVPEMSSRFRKYLFVLYYIRFFRGINRYIKNLKRNNKYDLSFCRKNIYRYASIIRSYIIIRQILSPVDLKKIEVLTQYHYDYEYPTNESRFQRAEELVRLYSNAQLVITSRIHCALPCLGLNTPVVFLQNDDDSIESTCRFDGLLNLLNIIHFRKNKVTNSIYSLPINIKQVKNSRAYSEYSNTLIMKCKKFETIR